MIETWRLGRTYGHVVAVAGVDVAVPAGEVLVLLGPNGAGKTTLLKLLAAAVRPTLGRGRVGGRDLIGDPDGVRALVGVLGHGSYLYDELTALENLVFAMGMRGLGTDRRRLLGALEGVGLDRFAGRRVRAFSAGMKRRLGLARLRLTEPALVLVDEPYAGLDQSGWRLFETVVDEAVARGGTVVMATHQLARAYEVADSVAILAGNRLAYFGRMGDTDLDGLRRIYTRCTEEPASAAAAAARRPAGGDDGWGGAEVAVRSRGAQAARPVEAPESARAAGEGGKRPATVSEAARPGARGGPDRGTAPGAVAAQAPVGAVASRDGAAAGRAAVPPVPAAPAAAAFLARVRAIVWKDLTIELRAKESVTAMLFFAALVLVIFAFALGPDRERLRDAAPGLLWLAFVFTGVLGLGRGLQVERENDALEGLLLCPGDRGAIYAGKLVGTLLFVGSVEILIIPLMGIIYNLDLWRVAPQLVGVALLGTLGFTALGTLYSALTVHLRFREVLLPLLLFPATVPVLLGGVETTAALIQNGSLGDARRWLGVLAAFDAVYVTACLLLFEYVIED